MDDVEGSAVEPRQQEGLPADPPEGSAAPATPAAPPRRSIWDPVRAVVKETAIVVVLSLVIATLVRIFLVQAFLIPSESMQDTLLVGDRVLVSKLSTRIGDIERGEVVVFADPGGWLSGPSAPAAGGVRGKVRDALEFVGVLPSNAEGHLIKRVIGVGGDHVVCCDAEGRITVNDRPLDESSYLYPGDAPSDDEFNILVPEGQLWVMGDHRSNSGDSRLHGTVPLERVAGRAVVIIWPVGRWAGLGRPDAFADLESAR